MVSWSGLYDDVGGTPHTLLVDTPTQVAGIRHAFTRRSLRKVSALVNTLLGAVAGSTATNTYTRAVAPTDAMDLGGNRAVETVTVISRATTAADVTALNSYMSSVTFQPTYPGDSSGNGK